MRRRGEYGHHSLTKEGANEFGVLACISRAKKTSSSSVRFSLTQRLKQTPVLFFCLPWSAFDADRSLLFCFVCCFDLMLFGLWSLLFTNG